MDGVLSVRYAERGDGQVAYAALGEGPLTLVYLSDALSAIDDYQSLPAAAAFMRRLQRLRRVVVMNLRGVGLSDPIIDLEAYPEAHADDLVAVLDAVGVDRIDVLTQGQASNPALRLAVRHPERVRSLVLVHPQVRVVADAEHPWGHEPETIDLLEAVMVDDVISASDQLELIAPSAVGDAEVTAWIDRTLRHGSSPRAVRHVFDQVRRDDARPLLADVAAPTLVLSRAGNRFASAEASRWTAEQIPGARYVELPGDDHVVFLGEVEPLLVEVEEQLVGTRVGRAVDRRLMTLLFSDLVASTDRAASVGDARWREHLDRHDAAVAEAVERHGGRLVKWTGDGALATFEAPGPALDAARALARVIERQGLEARFAVHTGEVELRGDDVGGIAVHVAARVLGEAGSGEVLMTAAVPLLVLGSAHRFTSRGEHRLRGVPVAMELFALDHDPEEWG